MKMKLIQIFLQAMVVCLIVIQDSSIFAEQVAGTATYCVPNMQSNYSCESGSYYASCRSFLGTLIKDAIDINLNLFSKETLIIAGIAVPSYFVARRHDRAIHHYFYDGKRHKNRRQLPYCCKVAAEKGLAIPLLTAAGLALFSKNEELQTTAYAFWVGLPCSWGYKKALKATKGNHCLRPPNQYFARHSKSYGGFPSGHVMEMAYVTTLFGLRYGPKVWVPLTAATAYVFAELAICNRHYVSQLVCGAAIGTAFGFATNKVVDKKLAKRLAISCELDQQLTPTLKCCYSF